MKSLKAGDHSSCARRVWTENSSVQYCMTMDLTRVVARSIATPQVGLALQYGLSHWVSAMCLSHSPWSLQRTQSDRTVSTNQFQAPIVTTRLLVGAVGARLSRHSIKMSLRYGFRLNRNQLRACEQCDVELTSPTAITHHAVLY